MGIFNAGSSIGSAMAPPAVWWLTVAFRMARSLHRRRRRRLLWLVLWLLLYDPPHKNRFLRAKNMRHSKTMFAARADAGCAAEKVAWSHVVRTPACIAVSIARALTDPVMYFVIFWLPRYLEKERHFDLAMVGRYSWVPFIFGGIGYVVGGWLSGWLIERGWGILSARKMAMLVGAMCLPVVIAAPHVPTATLAIAATCFLTIGHGFWVANLQTLPTDLISWI